MVCFIDLQAQRVVEEAFEKDRDAMHLFLWNQKLVSFCLCYINIFALNLPTPMWNSRPVNSLKSNTTRTSSFLV